MYLIYETCAMNTNYIFENLLLEINKITPALLCISEWKQKTKRHRPLSARDMPTKMAANGNRTHARTNQRRNLDRGRGNPWTHRTDFILLSHRSSVLIQAR